MKIIRDKLVDIIPEDEFSYVTQDYGTELLKAKLFEEITELMEATWEDLEEYADIIEVLMALAERHGVSWEKVEIARKIKQKQRGSFKDNVVYVK